VKNLRSGWEEGEKIYDVVRASHEVMVGDPPKRKNLLSLIKRGEKGGKKEEKREGNFFHELVGGTGNLIFQRKIEKERLS